MKNEMMTVATSNAAINATIKAIKATGKKLNELVQTGIVQCIQHAKDFGDCTGAARLIDSMPQTARRNEAINHFADFSPIRIVKDGRTGLMKASLRKKDDANFNDFNVEGVKANPWFERKSVTEREPGMPYDFDAADKDILSLADKLYNKSTAKNVTEEGEDGVETKRVVVKNDDRDSLRTMAAMLRVIHKDPQDAAIKLGLSKEQIATLGAVEIVDNTDADEQQGAEMVQQRAAG